MAANPIENQPAGNPNAGAIAGTTPDKDTQETREWMDALSAVIENNGSERAHF